MFVQRIEIGGQPSLRAEIAQLQVHQARARLQQQRRELAEQAAEAYYGLWSARQLEQLASLRMQLAQQLLAAAQRRFDAGDISRSQFMRVQVETSQAQSQLATARGEHNIARNRLNLLLQRPHDRELSVEGREQSSFELTKTALLAQLNVRPEVRIAELTAEVFRLEADLQGRQRVPDLEFEAYRSSLGAGSTVEQGVRLSLVLPLWDWGSNSALQAQKELQAEAAAEEARALKQSLEQQVLAAWELYLVADERRRLLEQQSQQYQAQADLAERGYAAGLLSLLEVLDAQRAYREGVQEFVAAEAAFQKRRWDLFWLGGGELKP